jgi:hypothetical protein
MVGRTKGITPPLAQSEGWILVVEKADVRPHPQTVPGDADEEVAQSDGILGMLGATATSRMPRQPPTRPMTIHGRRIPNRQVVRSLIRPKNGLPNMATSAPIPATSARLVGARSIPTRALIFNGNGTNRGARKTRLVLMNANKYSAMNRRPTRRVAGG